MADGKWNRDLISRFQTAMPDILKDQLGTILQENLTIRINDSVVQPLERTLLDCKQEVVASCETAAREISQRSQQIVEEMSAKIDRISASNQDRDGRDNSFLMMITDLQSKIEKQGVIWESVAQFAARLDESGTQGNEEESLAIAFQKTSSDLRRL